KVVVDGRGKAVQPGSQLRGVVRPGTGELPVDSQVAAVQPADIVSPFFLQKYLPEIIGGYIQVMVQDVLLGQSGIIGHFLGDGPALGLWDKASLGQCRK